MLILIKPTDLLHSCIVSFIKSHISQIAYNMEPTIVPTGSVKVSRSCESEELSNETKKSENRVVAIC